MEIKKSVMFLALLITLSLLFTILIISNIFGTQRETSIGTRASAVYQNIDELQKFMLMSDVYGDQMACLAFTNKLKELDKNIWDLGIKLENYRIASEEFQKSEYYKDQKKIFNENEVLYLMLLTKIKSKCNSSQSILTFFYRNSADCKKCDDQSFVLTDINSEIDPEISVFSFDMDLNLTTLDLLSTYYKIDELPCIIIDEHKYCGIQDKNFVIEKMCQYNPEISICKSRTLS